jgi:membrane-bound lytic murein transglycosylase D
MSERSLINTLLVVCLTLGFICVAAIYLPSKLGNAQTTLPKTRLSLSSLLPKLSEPARTQEEPVPVGNGTFVRFTPAGGPEQFDLAQASASRWKQESDERLKPKEEKVATALPPPQEPPASRYTKVHRHSSLVVYDRSKESRERSPFVIPKELEAEVAFWRDIYSKYNGDQVVLHDMDHLTIVYGVIDLTNIAANTALTDIERQKARQDRIDAEKESILAILTELTQNPSADQLSSRAREIKRMFDAVNEPDKFRKAKERGIRAQTGQKDKFIAGLAYSGKYLGEIEAIFEKAGLPRDLTYLVFVESMFNPAANSSAGARGVWQFMRGTAKIYGLKMNSLIDERGDPIRETYAAASLLRHDYENLGSWPLAVNAYNTGRGRITQAMSRLGTSNIATIIRYFDHQAYGFASRNFYLEFLAAMDVAKNYQKYFGNIRFDPPLRYDLIEINYPVRLPDVAQATNIPIETLAELNPGYTQAVFSGKLPLPMGAQLRVPENKGDIFLAYCARTPTAFPFWHVVEEGETLEDIAAMYNVPVSSLRQENKIGKRLRAGQELRITR